MFLYLNIAVETQHAFHIILFFMEMYLEQALSLICPCFSTSLPLFIIPLTIFNTLSAIYNYKCFHFIQNSNYNLSCQLKDITVEVCNFFVGIKFFLVIMILMIYLNLNLYRTHTNYLLFLWLAKVPAFLLQYGTMWYNFVKIYTLTIKV